jgi:tRNA/rRNA methyltransferase
VKKNREGAAVVDTGASRSAHSNACDPCAVLLDRVRVVLCRPRHPGNIGAAARALKTMGLSRLMLVCPERYDEAGAVEARARASGAGDVLDSMQVVGTIDEALAGTVCAAALTARVREVEPPRVVAGVAAARLLSWAAGGQEVALVFGSETAGLTNEEVMRCDLIVSLPANPAYSSLNLAAAVQVLAYELRLAAGRQTAVAQQEAAAATGARSSSTALSPPATRDEVERLIVHLERTMAYSGFFDAGNPKRLMPKLRRLFGRAALEVDEVNILRGFLASVEKLRKI